MFDDYSVEDTIQLLIEDHVRERELDSEETHTFTRRDWIAMYYNAAESEMLWRERSIGMAAGYERFVGRWTEKECRDNMKEARELQKRIALIIHY